MASSAITSWQIDGEKVETVVDFIFLDGHNFTHNRVLRKEETENRLHLESRTPSWAGLWTRSYMPSIYGNNIPTGKPGPPDGRAPGLVPRLSVA